MAERSAALDELVAIVRASGPHGLTWKDMPRHDDGRLLAAAKVAYGLGLIRPALQGPGLVANLEWAQPLPEGTEPLPCRRCKMFKGSRAHCVPGHGDHQAEIACIGEGLGEEEERRHLPFVGRAGDVLNRALRTAGLHREEVFDVQFHTLS